MSTQQVDSPTPVTEIVVADRSEFEGLRDQAAVLARTELVPDAFQNKPDDIVVVFLMARELRIGPMQALQDIHVIKGRPGLSAKLMMGLVQREGHDIWLDDASDDRSATCHGIRKGSERAESFTFTVDDAEQAHLFGLKQQMWEKYPKAMLRARAVSGLCRQTFADVILGFGYTPEELRSEHDTKEVRQPPVLPPIPKKKGLPGVHPEWVERLQVEYADVDIIETAQTFIHPAKRQIQSLHDLSDVPATVAIEIARKLRGPQEAEVVTEPKVPDACARHEMYQDDCPDCQLVQS